jgi:hypothetical protein
VAKRVKCTIPIAQTTTIDIIPTTTPTPTTSSQSPLPVQHMQQQFGNQILQQIVPSQQRPIQMLPSSMQSIQQNSISTMPTISIVAQQPQQLSLLPALGQPAQQQQLQSILSPVQMQLPQTIMPPVRNFPQLQQQQQQLKNSANFMQSVTVDSCSVSFSF